MPLHLLGKKSWNVYNPKNIERVRRDEAAAQAREEAEEQHQQDVDAERRLAILRGEVPPPLPAPRSPSIDDIAPSRKRDRDEPAASSFGRERKKRKRTGEDDTDFELRLARERAGAGPAQATTDALVKSTSNAPLIDHAGHINLFPEERTRAHSQKNEEAEKEAAKKKKEYEDQYTMRFSNAAGKEELISPWYSKGGDTKDIVDSNLNAPGKDVWGNEDPRRKEREASRVVANDPLAMMKRGAAKMREVEKERRQLNKERERELNRLRKEERRQGRRRGREGREHDDLEGFTLDGTASSHPPERSKDDDHHRRRHRQSQDEGERSKHRSEHREHRDDDQRRSSRSDHQDREKGSSKRDRRREGRADNY
ncbi:hypothetical protein F4677DRAFT_119549 [Hypoxylon crocopeplum]|nr:hypothetical protein F4677DRAFT_119549 [Hypoxylon crocopeplum]